MEADCVELHEAEHVEWVTRLRGDPPLHTDSRRPELVHHAVGIRDRSNGRMEWVARRSSLPAPTAQDKGHYHI